MIVLWAFGLVVGIAAAGFASRRAVTGALEIADAAGVSKGIVGVTLMAVGTDLPEIANSISASVTGHGDLIVGDATGSALTQITLILGVLLVIAPSLRTGTDTGRDLVLPVGALTVVATIVIALLIADRDLTRSDGLVLVAIWAVGMVALVRWQRADHVVDARPTSVAGLDIVRVLGWLGVVAVSAMLVVSAFVELADALGVPELVASTVVLALGTSVPELVVDWTAVRRGAVSLAIGDLFGSSLVDSTLSIGIGPVVRSTTVSEEAVTSVALIAVGIAAATLAWRFGPRRPVPLAACAFAIYGIVMGSLIIVTA